MRDRQQFDPEATSSSRPPRPERFFSETSETLAEPYAFGDSLLEKLDRNNIQIDQAQQFDLEGGLHDPQQPLVTKFQETGSSNQNFLFDQQHPSLGVDIGQLEFKARQLVEQNKFNPAFKLVAKSKFPQLNSAVIFVKQSAVPSAPDQARALDELDEYIIMVARVFNQHGMSLLNQQKHEACQKLFSNILQVLKRFQTKALKQTIGLTLNNLSCSYKKSGQLKKAQECLTAALNYQAHAPMRHTPAQDFGRENPVDTSQAKNEDESALTELNLCAIYSQKGDHRTAISHIKSSIQKLEGQMEQIKGQIQQKKMLQMQAQQQISIPEPMYEHAREKQSLLAIAYYNLGCQHEYLKNFSKSLEGYSIALKLESNKFYIFSDANSPPNLDKSKSPLVDEFRKSFMDVKSKMKRLRQTSSYRHKKPEPIVKKTFTNLVKSDVEQIIAQSQKRGSVHSGSPNGDRFKLKNLDLASQASTVVKNVEHYFPNDPKEVHNSLRRIEEAKGKGRKRPMSAKVPIIPTRFTQSVIKDGPEQVNFETGQIKTGGDPASHFRTQNTEKRLAKAQTRRLQPIKKFDRKDSKMSQKPPSQGLHVPKIMNMSSSKNLRRLRPKKSKSIINGGTVFEPKKGSFGSKFNTQGPRSVISEAMQSQASGTTGILESVDFNYNQFVKADQVQQSQLRELISNEQKKLLAQQNYDFLPLTNINLKNSNSFSKIKMSRGGSRGSLRSSKQRPETANLKKKPGSKMQLIKEYQNSEDEPVELEELKEVKIQSSRGQVDLRKSRPQSAYVKGSGNRYSSNRVNQSTLKQKPEKLSKVSSISSLDRKKNLNFGANPVAKKKLERPTNQPKKIVENGSITNEFDVESERTQILFQQQEDSQKKPQIDKLRNQAGNSFNTQPKIQVSGRQLKQHPSDKRKRDNSKTIQSYKTETEKPSTRTNQTVSDYNGKIDPKPSTRPVPSQKTVSQKTVSQKTSSIARNTERSRGTLKSEATVVSSKVDKKPLPLIEKAKAVNNRFTPKQPSSKVQVVKKEGKTVGRYGENSTPSFEVGVKSTDRVTNGEGGSKMFSPPSQDILVIQEEELQESTRKERPSNMFQIYQMLTKQRDYLHNSADPGVCGTIEDFRQSFEVNPDLKVDQESEISMIEESEGSGGSDGDSWMHHDSDSQLGMDDIKDLVAKQIQKQFNLKNALTSVQDKEEVKAEEQDEEKQKDIEFIKLQMTIKIALIASRKSKAKIDTTLDMHKVQQLKSLTSQFETCILRLGFFEDVKQKLWQVRKEILHDIPHDHVKIKEERLESTHSEIGAHLDLDSASQESEEVYDYGQLYLDYIYAGLDSTIRFPLNFVEVDMDHLAARGAAFQRFREVNMLQIFQYPYLCRQYGLCQIVFILRQKQNMMQVLLFQASSSPEKMLRKMKMNREYKLINLGINLNLSRGLQNFRRNSLKEERPFDDESSILDRQQVDQNVLMLRAVETLCKGLEGDVYKDFYQFGEPSSYTLEDDFKGFNFHLDDKATLQAQLGLKKIAAESFDLVHEREIMDQAESLIQALSIQILAASKIQERNQEDSDEEELVHSFPYSMIVESDKQEDLDKSEDGHQLNQVNLEQGPETLNFTIEIYRRDPPQNREGSIFKIVAVEGPSGKDPKVRNAQFQTGPDLADLIFDHPQAIEQYISVVDYSYNTAAVDKKFSIEAFKKCNQLETLKALIQSKDPESQDMNIEEMKMSPAPVKKSREPKFNRGMTETIQTSIVTKEYHRREAVLESPVRYEDLNARQKYEIIKSKGTVKSPKGKSPSQFKPQESKYSSIFESRKQIANELDQLRPDIGTDFKKDPKMWRYQVRNKYEYSVLKIQQWWRRRYKVPQYVNLVTQAKNVCLHSTMNRNLASQQAIQNLSQIELELRFIDQKGAIEKIKKIQRLFRLKHAMRKYREKIASNK